MAEKKAEKKQYDCPFCSVALNWMTDSDAAGHWNCPGCSVNFYDEQDLINQIKAKVEGK